MILKNKKLLIITSLLTLLPIPVGLLLWNQFPETMAIHFGFTGQADGYASPSVAVFVLPLIMLALQWVCILGSTLDKRNQNRNQKIQSLVLWIIPLIGNLSILGIYALSLGVEFSPVAWTMIFIGLTFAAIGNYMPKTRMNATIGIKIRWTYSSEANWNATHRLAGKLWVAGGIAIALLFWLPHLWAIIVMFSILTVITVLPVLYSRQYYKKEKAAGKELKKDFPAVDPKTKKISGSALVLTFVLVAVVMFFGDIDFVYGEEKLLVDANMYSDYVISYDKMDAVEFREGNVPGLRVGGFGSFRLLMGFFENEEFGTYTRYTYFRPEACVVITSGDKKIVLSGKTYEDTEKLYENLLVLTAE